MASTHSTAVDGGDGAGSLKQRHSTAGSAPSAGPSSSPAPAKPKNGVTAVIRELAPSLAIFSYPFSRFGIFPVGGRSTAVKLNDGKVWVLASTPLDEPTKAKIESMGDVAYLVAPDAVHHLFLSQYASAYPSAKVIGVEGLEEKRKDVKFDGIYGRDPPETKYGFESEIQARYFPTFANKDVIFNHVETRTLITADLLFNLPAHEQYRNTAKGAPSSPIPFLNSLSNYFTPDSSFHKTFLGFAGVGGTIPHMPKGGSKDERRKRFAQDAAEVAKWDFDRIVMCHGDVIEKDGKKAWLSACEKYLDPSGNPKV
ncbi:uncharacterized protein PSFLO_04057 [Pseudozyma flocculosa]|nr:uncharacterized protein PSFLO_04057 [Pseudozyma flocculosa]